MDLLSSPGFQDLLNATRPQRVGEVESVVGLSVQVRGLRCSVGEVVLLGDGAGTPAEVVALDGDIASCMPLDNLDGLAVGAPVRGTGVPAMVPVGPALLGRVIDAAGRPIDGKGPIFTSEQVPINAAAPNALERARIDTPVAMGVRVLDTLVTLERASVSGFSRVPGWVNPR